MGIVPFQWLAGLDAVNGPQSLLQQGMNSRATCRFECTHYEQKIKLQANCKCRSQKQVAGTVKTNGQPTTL